jgi:hypothetical protein
LEMTMAKWMEDGNDNTGQWRLLSPWIRVRKSLREYRWHTTTHATNEAVAEAEADQENRWWREQIEEVHSLGVRIPSSKPRPNHHRDDVDGEAARAALMGVVGPGRCGQPVFVEMTEAAAGLGGDDIRSRSWRRWWGGSRQQRRGRWRPVLVDGDGGDDSMIGWIGLGGYQIWRRAARSDANVNGGHGRAAGGAYGFGSSWWPRGGGGRRGKNGMREGRGVRKRGLGERTHGEAGRQTHGEWRKFLSYFHSF